MTEKLSLETAKAVTLRYLSYRARSEFELKKHLLKKGFSQNVIDAVLAWTETYHLVNDRQFAQSWLENRQLLKPMGKRRLVQELKEKGIQPDIITACLADYQTEQEYQNAKGLVEAKLQRALKPIPVKKLLDWLVRRGFPVSVSVKIVKELAMTSEWGGKMLNS